VIEFLKCFQPKRIFFTRQARWTATVSLPFESSHAAFCKRRFVFIEPWTEKILFVKLSRGLESVRMDILLRSSQIRLPKAQSTHEDFMTAVVTASLLLIPDSSNLVNRVACFCNSQIFDTLIIRMDQKPIQSTTINNRATGISWRHRNVPTILVCGATGRLFWTGTHTGFGSRISQSIDFDNDI